jgi:hypothetical protein
VNKVLSSGHGAEYVHGASPPVPEGRPKPAVVLESIACVPSSMRSSSTSS